MTYVAHDSQAQGEYNEDFRFRADLPDGQIVIAVGDFAHSTFTGLDKLAEGFLKESLEDNNCPSVSSDLLLAQLASQFNNNLCNHHIGFKKSFQCCVVFASVSGSTLHYLPIGDCRISVRREDTLFLLNGSMWVDAAGNPLPPMITTKQQMQRGNEDPPSKVLGVMPEAIPPSLVQEFALEAWDQIALYSDGVDKVLSPGEVLALLIDANGEPPETIASRVLTQARVNHSDDDRTFLIAVGKHEPIESPAVIADRKQLAEARQEIDGKMKDLDERMQSVDALLQLARENEEKVSLLTSAIKTITDEVKNVIATTKDRKTHNAQPQVLEQLGEIGKQMQKVLIHIKNVYDDNGKILEALSKLDDIKTEIAQAGSYAAMSYDAANLARDSVDKILVVIPPIEKQLDRLVDETPKQGTQYSLSARSAQPGVETLRSNARVNPLEPAITGSSKTYSSYVQPVNWSAQSREGVVCVMNGSIALVDDVDVIGPAADTDSQTGYITASSDAPAGWLVAWYLYIRKLSDRPRDLPAESVMHWMMQQPTELLSNLDSQLLLDLRAGHWELRDRRRKIGISYRAYSKQITECEEALSRNLYGRLGVKTDEMEPPSADGQTHEALTTKAIGKLRVILEILRLPRVGIPFALVLIIIGSVVLFKLLSTPSETPVQTDTNAGMAQPEGRWHLEYGADGRTLLINDTKNNRQSLGFRVRYGSEGPFHVAIPKDGFPDQGAVRKWIDSENIKQLVVPRGSAFELPPRLKSYKVELQDITGGDPCARFLTRVNDLLPTGVHTYLEDLKTLNPGMRCEQLRADDELIVFGKPNR